MKTIIFFLLLLFVICETKGQSLNNKRPFWGFYGMYDLPALKFAREGYLPGMGGGIEYYSRSVIPDSTSAWGLRIGGSVSKAGHGSVINDVLLHDPNGAPGTQQLKNSLTRFDIHAMVLRGQGNIRPYVDFFTGLAVFNSKQVLQINHPLPGYQARTATGYQLSSQEYGASVGCLVRLSANTFLNLKGTVYGYSGPVQFMNLNHLSYDGRMYMPSNPLVQPSMIAFQVGLIFKISPSSNTGYTAYTGGGGSYYYSHSYYRPSCGRSYYSGYHSSGHCGGGRPLR